MKRIDTVQILPKNEKQSLPPTPRPHRKVPERSSDEFSNKEGISPRSDPGNRVGRHFRNNNSRFQSITEKVVSPSPSPLTTKQPFRVYYFEPKRRKSKDSEDKERSKYNFSLPLFDFK